MSVMLENVMQNIKLDRPASAHPSSDVEKLSRVRSRDLLAPTPRRVSSSSSFTGVAHATAPDSPQFVYQGPVVVRSPPPRSFAPTAAVPPPIALAPQQAPLQQQQQPLTLPAQLAAAELTRPSSAPGLAVPAAHPFALPLYLETTHDTSAPLPLPPRAANPIVRDGRFGKKVHPAAAALSKRLSLGASMVSSGGIAQANMKARVAALAGAPSPLHTSWVN